MGRYLDRLCLSLALCFATTLGSAQQPATSIAPQTSIAIQSLPPTRELLLDVERNEKAAEAARKDYTYHVHLEQQDLDSKGNVKKTIVTDAESVAIDGVRVDRVVARNGRPLTPGEASKESDRIDKEVTKDKERREKREDQGEDTDSRGDVILPASRILELGNFTNPRRIDLDGRPTIVIDYAGDPNAKTRNRFESIVRDLVGTAWIDEQDRVLVRAQGHFLNDFKIGGGLVVDIKRDSSFQVRYAKINQEVWLPADVSGQGKIRFLLFAGFDGRIHLVTSDYRKFRSTTTIIPTGREIGPDGQPVPNAPSTKPPSTSPSSPQ